ncbi:MAG: OsmC family protein [Pseudomonadota bacterium]|nr:OsmC family protein [Pseudomonadota bacterium]
MATYFKRKADAVWNGGGNDGSGQLTTQSGTLSGARYSAEMRFGEAKGTNPEELVAAAHAGCFNMALAFGLSGQGHPPGELRTTAEVRIEQEGAGWTVKSVALTLRGRVPGISAEEFRQAAEGAKAGCPISKLFKADITLDAQLET